MRRLLLSLVIAAAGAIVLVSLAACSGATGSTNGTGATGGSNPTIQMDVLNGEKAGTFGILAPDGAGHDTFAPAHFTAQAGTTYTVKVYNYDEGAHTFTIDELGINQVISPRTSDSVPSVTTFTVTFSKAGVFRFYCKLPCDAGHGGWAMTTDRTGKGSSQDGFMGGYVTVI